MHPYTHHLFLLFFFPRMNRILCVAFAVTLLVCAASSQGKVSRFSVTRLEEAAQSIAQIPVLKKIAEKPTLEIAPKVSLEKSITPTFLKSIESVQNKAEQEFQRALVEGELNLLLNTKLQKWNRLT